MEIDAPKNSIGLSQLKPHTCELRIMLYKSSLGTATGGGFLTMESFILLRILLALGLGGGVFNDSARWSSSRRACDVATNSKNSSFCSEVMEEKTTVENGEGKGVRWVWDKLHADHLNFSITPINLV